MPRNSTKSSAGVKSPNPPRRKGALRMSEIPPDVLAGLNEGRLEAITLVEWLAIDVTVLLRHVIPSVGLEDRAPELLETAGRLREQGVTRRMWGVGEALHGSLNGHPRREPVFRALASHPSDMARGWAAYTLAADDSLKLAERLRAARPFAADRSAAVRECAWDAIRPYIAADLKQGFRLLRTWAREADPNVRRCAIEATRPRGVWCKHIEALKKDPEPGLVLLKEVRSDPSDYVRRSAANWLNDASKTRPDWVRAVCKRWLKESPTAETKWIVNHALRTLRKKKPARKKR
jgi:3-methyladenine DNA glycosylase AlkC